MLNKSKGNMYLWVSHTWNVIKGKCPHDCSYCYMKRYPQAELHFDEKELKTNLGSGNTIFVGSSCDMWADKVMSHVVKRILEYCASYRNSYVFQSKNPQRFCEFVPHFPFNTMLGTTIETNRLYGREGGQPIGERVRAFQYLKLPRFVSIEPIMDFDLDVMVGWTREINPEFISIGANSRPEIKLPEPSGDKVRTLIEGLKEFTEVKIKDNLKRLFKA